MSATDPEREGNGDGPPKDHSDHPDLDVDTAFAAIIAGWESQEAPSGRVPWPDAENIEPAGTAPPAERPGGRDGETPMDRLAADREPTRPDLTTHPEQPPVAESPQPIESVQPVDSVESMEPVEPLVPGVGIARDRPEDAEQLADRFVPPDPPPAPRADRITRLAWVGVVGGPCLLLLAALVWPDLPEVLLLCAVGAFIAGFVTLVARMPHQRDDDDGDGAVV